MCCITTVSDEVLRRKYACQLNCFVIKNRQTFITDEIWKLPPVCFILLKLWYSLSSAMPKFLIAFTLLIVVCASSEPRQISIIGNILSKSRQFANKIRYLGSEIAHIKAPVAGNKVIVKFPQVMPLFVSTCDEISCFGILLKIFVEKNASIIFRVPPMKPS